MRVVAFFSYVPSVKHGLVPDTVLRIHLLFVLFYFYLFMAMIWFLDGTYIAVVPVLGFYAKPLCSARLALWPFLRWSSLRDHCPRQWEELGPVWKLDDWKMAWSFQTPVVLSCLRMSRIGQVCEKRVHQLKFKEIIGG